MAHAGWNLIARRQRAAGLPYFRRVLAVIMGLGLVPALLSLRAAGPMAPRAAGFAVVSGLTFGLYYWTLTRCYRSLAFSAAYPVLRGLAVFLIAAGDVLLGRPLGIWGVGGMCFVAVGCVLASFESFREVGFSRFRPADLRWPGAAALCIVAFTLLDKTASKWVPPGPAGALQYGYILYFFAFVGIALATSGRAARGRPSPWRWAALAGAMDYGGYVLLLWAFQLASNAAYVYAFRQVSIAVGVLLAVMLLRERGAGTRLTASALIVAGAVLIVMRG